LKYSITTQNEATAIVYRWFNLLVSPPRSKTAKDSGERCLVGLLQLKLFMPEASPLEYSMGI
jgi:hypothetical protein